MTDLPPMQYLDAAAKAFGFPSWYYFGDGSNDRTSIITHARALHENAQLRAEIAALRPRETLEQVARREVDLLYRDWTYQKTTEDYGVSCFLRAAEMARKGELPDE